jgi:hypothetical protein
MLEESIGITGLGSCRTKLIGPSGKGSPLMSQLPLHNVLIHSWKALRDWSSTWDDGTRTQARGTLSAGETSPF